MIQFELRPPVSVPSQNPSPEKSTRKMKRPRKKASDVVMPVVAIEIAQDPTALRSRNGDTGSVVWRAR